MHADVFYKSDARHAVPLLFLTASDLNNKNQKNISVFERNCLNTQQFNGEIGDVGIISDVNGVCCKAYIGLSLDKTTDAIAIAVNRLPAGIYLAPSGLTQEGCVTWSLAQYAFDKYKQNTRSPRILVVPNSNLNNILIESQAIFLVRDLINMPANDLDPQAMAHVVSKLSKTYDADFTQWVGDELIRDNYPAIHAVGRAAASPPRLLSLTWGDESHPKVTLVGKGVCFDSGGLDIKPAAGMRLMKKDMGGAAHVIGLAQWMMAYGLPIRLQVLIPAVENAVGSQAFRPGDVLRMRNGLTVEVDNTDAEGRLVLADALVHACEHHPELLIDFATLTGAARIAVGTEISAMFTNNDAIAEALLKSGDNSNDPLWRMPLFASYASLISSSIADLANSSASSYAGAITAALFLQRFVNANTPWVHLDIMAWNVGSKPGRPDGGEAMGLLAVGRYLIARYGNHA